MPGRFSNSPRLIEASICRTPDRSKAALRFIPFYFYACRKAVGTAPDVPDDWADGSNGYLKKDFVIARAEAAGFEFVAESDVNTNPDDQPSTDEAVWRLPPSLRLPEDAENPDALRAEYEAIGESHRMTLKFRKP